MNVGIQSHQHAAASFIPIRSNPVVLPEWKDQLSLPKEPSNVFKVLTFFREARDNTQFSFFHKTPRKPFCSQSVSRVSNGLDEGNISKLSSDNTVER